MCVLSKIVMCFLDLESNVKVLALVDSRQGLLSVSGRHFIAAPFRGKEHYSHLVLEAVMASGVMTLLPVSPMSVFVLFVVETGFPL